jgi:hypothetical protein
MTLAELLIELYNVTSRPDLTAASTSAIKAATLKLHSTDYYYKDLVETTISFPTAETIQSFDYKTTFPRWRNIKYLRKIDPVTLAGAGFFTIVPVDMVVDGVSINREDVCYMAGSTLNIRSSSEEQNFIIGYYQHPSILDPGYSSWIAEELPFAIVYEAARTIFKTIGKDEEEARMRNLIEGDPRNPNDLGYVQQIKVLGLAELGGY